jgi:ketosteroid isomerase-like protein
MSNPISRVSFALAALTVISAYSLGRGLAAQSADETAIRQLQPGPDAWTDDLYFFSARFVKPVLGKETRENAPPTGERRNFKSEDTIDRVEIAKSGDLAWAHGMSVLSWDGIKPFQAGFLRVYRKEGGRWKIAAVFARPLGRCREWVERPGE